MNSWPPDFDESIDESFEVITDEECEANIAGERIIGTQKGEETDLMSEGQFEEEKTEIFGLYSDQNAPFEGFNFENRQRVEIETRECRQSHKEMKRQPLSPRSKVYAYGSSSTVTDTKKQYPATNVCAGTRRKATEEPRIFRKVRDDEVGSIRKDKQQYSDALDADVITESDVKIAFTSSEADEIINQNEKKLNKKHSKISHFVSNFGKVEQSHQVPSHTVKKPTNNEFTDNPLTKDPNINTFGDALKYFKLYPRLQLLEISLDDVRRHQRSKEMHQSDLKQFDKDIQKLSFKFHPDKVKGRGGSEEELVIAEKLQTALNSTRTILKVLHEAFLEDIDTDHKYGYYVKLNLSLLGNEDEVRNQVYKVLFKISFISQIKRQNIIAEIRNFLTEGKKCVEKFFDGNVKEFEDCRNLAFLYLKKCIKGYKKLLSEFNAVEEECREENLDNIIALIRKMASSCSRNLHILKDIKKLAKKSLSGGCQFYSTSEPLDDYFVLPFASYINIIIMCNVILKNPSQSFWGNFRYSCQDPVYNHSTHFLIYLYYLASYYSGDKQYKHIVERTMQGRHVHSEEIRKEFRQTLLQLNNYLEDKFKVENYYIENSRRNHLLEEYEKCMKMMADFKTKEKELKNDIQNLASRNQEIEDKYDEAMRESAELSNKVKERLEESKLLREKFSVSYQEK